MTVKYKSAILIAILLVGFILRLHNLNVWPRDGATFDEYAWTFLGLSLITEGKPVSWSPHNQYADKVRYRNPQGASFFLVSPYLEHPPLFGLVAGGYEYLQGIRSFDGVSPEKIRPLALLLGVISIAAVYLLAAEAFGVLTGLLAALFYSITPSVVAGSRLVQNENFFIPLFLVALYSSLRVVKDPKSKLKYLLFPILFLLPLAKVPWIAASVSVAAIFFFNRRTRNGFAALFAGLGGIIAYVLWGFWWNRDLFIRLMGLQLARYDLGYTSVFSLITDPIVTDRLFIDGMVYAGWIAVVSLLTVDLKKTFPVIFGLLGYLAIYLFVIPNEPGHGWYRYPFYPFLLISLAYIVKELHRNHLVAMSLILVAGLPALGYTVGPLIGFSYPVYRGFLALTALGALPVVFRDRRFSFTSKKVNLLLFVVVLFMTVVAAATYNEQ